MSLKPRFSSCVVDGAICNCKSIVKPIVKVNVSKQNNFRLQSILCISEEIVHVTEQYLLKCKFHKVTHQHFDEYSGPCVYKQ